MKLASLYSGRDGRLVVVDRDLSRAVSAESIAPTLQTALDDWEVSSPKLQALYEELCRGGTAGAFPLAPDQLAAPLPRAFQWLDGSSYLNHVELVRKSRGASLPPSYWSDPLMYQGASDILLGPRADIVAGSEEWGVDLEAEVVVITGDVPMGATPEQCAREIRLLALVNDVSLRNLIPGELEKGLGFIHGKPPTAFSPVVVTPDELGGAWRDGKLHLPLRVFRNDVRVGCPNAGEDMVFGFYELVSHAARTRPLSAGTIVGSGTVSNRDTSRGSCCIAERRVLEVLEHGEARTPFLGFGERVRIEMLDDQGRSIFGAIDQAVVPAKA